MSSTLGLQIAYTTDLSARSTVFRFAAASTLSQPFTARAPFPVDAFTVALWLRTTTGTGTIVAYTPSSGTGVTVAAPGALTVTTGTSGTVTTTVNVADGEWHHLAVAIAPRGRTRLELSLYVDGLLVHRAPGALTADAGGLSPVGTMTLGPLTADTSNLQLWRTVQQPLEVLTSMSRRVAAGTLGLELTWWLDSLQAEGPNTIDSFVPSSPPLFFRQPTGTDWVEASFVPDGTSPYVVQVASDDGLWWWEETTSTGSAAVPGVLLGRTYRARVGTLGASFDDPVTLIPVDMAAPALVMTWPSQLTANWCPVDQAGAYAVSVQAGATSLQTSTSTTALDAHLDDPEAVRLAVRAQLGPTLMTAGPAAATGSVNAPDEVRFLFDPGSDGSPQRVEASWAVATPADPFVYALVGREGFPATSSGHADGGTGTLAVPLTGAGYAPGDVVECALRAVRPGVLSAWVTQAIHVADLGPAPILYPLRLSPTGRTVTISWDFDADRFVGGASYRVSVVLDGVEQGPFEVTSTTTSWTAPAGSEGQSVVIKVRATALHSLGRWSTSACLKIGSPLGAPVITSACVDTALNLTVTWNAVRDATGYRLTLGRPGHPEFSKTLAVGNLTIVTWPRSDTGLTATTQYTLTVTATGDGVPDGPDSAPYAFSTADLSPGPGPTPIGEPVNQVTGQYLYAHQDLSAAGVVPLEFVSYYTSPPTGTKPPESDLSPGWSHSYDIGLTVTGNVATVRLAGTVRLLFTVPASLSGDCPKQGPPTGDSLFADTGGSFVLTRRNGDQYRFDAAGEVQSFTRRDGNQVSFAHAEGLLSSVTDVGSGRSLLFTHENGLLAKVTSGPLTVSFTRDHLGDVVRVTNAAARHRDFTYASGSLLATVSDENGHVFVTNTYGADGRLSSQRTPRGTLTMTYEDGHDANGFATVTTTAVDAAGYTTTYYATVQNQQIGYELLHLTTAATGDVRLVRRTFDGLSRLAAEGVYQGPPPSSMPPPAGLAFGTTRYAYDAPGNVTEVTAPDGSTVSASYNADGTLATTTDTLGNVTTYSWSGGLLQRVDEPLGYSTRLGYRDVGGARNLIRQISVHPGNAAERQPVANVTTFEYQSTGELTSITRPGDVVERRGYDSLGRRTSRTVVQGSVPLLTETWDLDAGTGWMTTRRTQWGTQTAAQAFVEEFTYDGVGSLTAHTNALRETTARAYTDDNLLASVTFPAAPGTAPTTQTLTRDGYGWVTGLTLSLQPLVTFCCTKDPLGRPTSFRDGNGLTTTYTWQQLTDGYDVPCSRCTTTYPAMTGASEHEVESLTADALGRAIAETRTTLADDQPTAPVTTYAYGTVGTPPAAEYSVTQTLPPPSPDGRTSTRVTVLDARGRTVREVDERGKAWTTVYDTVSTDGMVYERARRVDPGGGAVVTLTDAFGRTTVRELLDTDGATVLSSTSISYDALGRPTAITETGAEGTPLPATTFSYAYDATTDLLVVAVKRYGEPGSSTYSFDGAGRWRGHTDAAGIEVTFSYEPSGLLSGWTNGRNQTTTYGYDAAGRLTTTTPPSPGETVAHVLDGNGNRTQTLVGASTAITRTFDQRNRLLTRLDLSAGETVESAWWPGGTLKTLRYPGVSTPVAYAYDDLGRLTTVTDWLGGVTRYSWFPSGQLAGASLPGGTSVRRTIDEAGRLTAAVTTAPDGTILHSAAFTLDGAGRPRTADWILPLAPPRPTGSLSMTYGGDRLLTSGEGQTVGYDGDGDTTSLPDVSAAALSYDERGRLTSLLGRALTYDPDGLRRTVLVDGTPLRATWDASGYSDFYGNRGDNRTAVQGSVTAPSPAGPLMTEPLVGSPPTRAPTGQSLPRLLALTDADDHVVARHVYGIGLIETVRDTGVTVHAYDQVGSTVALVDAASGRVTDRYVYDPYGQVIAQDGATPNPFRLHGQWGVADTTEGVIGMGSRDYLPATMRFAQRDVLFGDVQEPQSLNRYAFLGGNPLQMVDPFGYAAQQQDKNEHEGRGWLAAILGGLTVVTALALGWALGESAPLAGALAGGAAGTGAAVGTGQEISVDLTVLSHAYQPQPHPEGWGVCRLRPGFILED